MSGAMFCLASSDSSLEAFEVAGHLLVRKAALTIASTETAESHFITCPQEDNQVSCFIPMKMEGGRKPN